MRVLLTGATGAVGHEVRERLLCAPGVEVTGVSRRGDAERGVLAWQMGKAPAPEQLRGHWDVIVHSAADTRWTMTYEQATQANVAPLRDVLALTDPDTHLVHVSTAYTTGLRGDGYSTDRADYRNAYEWSKATAEQWLRARRTDYTVVRPSLVIGRRHDGYLCRFSGAYTLLHALTSGLAAALVGDEAAQVDIVPVDVVADEIVAAVTGNRPTGERITRVVAGAAAATFAEVVDQACAVLNEYRKANDVLPLAIPPFITVERWERFFLPFGREVIGKHHLRAIDLLAAFQTYVGRPQPMPDGHPGATEPLVAFAHSVQHWIDRHPRPALRVPQEWEL